MIIKIPLEVYLIDRELDEGTTLMTGPYVGKFLYTTADNEYVVHIGKNELASYPANELAVPIKIQRYYILDPTDPDIQNLSTK